MGKGSKQQFKQFPINSLEDACLALGEIISGITINLHRYKLYAIEAGKLLQDTDSEYIPADVYEAIYDKLLNRQHEMLMFTADYQSNSFSYINLRKMLMKKGFLKDQLSEEIANILKDLLDVRNWTFHNPQSLMVAAREVMEKSFPTHQRENIQFIPQLNPVIVCVADKYETLMLTSLLIHTKRRINEFDTVLSSIKTDYQTLYDLIPNGSPPLVHGISSSEVKYVECHIVSRLLDISSDISRVSMAIHKSEYDGTDEGIKLWVDRPVDECNDKDSIE